MNTEKQKPDWSEEHWREMLVEQRKSMWLEDTLDKLAAWLGLRHGMTAIDVGCGLGYLGYTYWPYFGQGGRYIGVDRSEKLVSDGAQAAVKWAVAGRAEFMTGDACQLPFPDNYADTAMCQTLLMHLDNPKAALAEMVRVTKPGGLIFCQEPDNLSSALAKGDSSMPELDIDERLLSAKINLLGSRGHTKLGRGDISTGAQVPRMMSELGLLEIDARLNDRVQLLLPPYETPQQQQMLKMIKSRWFDDSKREYWREIEKEEFLAGGGEPSDWERIIQIAERLTPVVRQQLTDGEFYLCGCGFFYIVKGRKRS